MADSHDFLKEMQKLVNEKRKPSELGATRFPGRNAHSQYENYQKDTSDLEPVAPKMDAYMCERASGHLRTLSVNCGRKQSFDEDAKVMYCKTGTGDHMVVGGFVFNLPYQGGEHLHEEFARKLMKGWQHRSPVSEQTINVVLQYRFKSDKAEEAERWRLGTFEPGYFFRLGKFNKVLLIRQGLKPNERHMIFEWLFGRNSREIRGLWEQLKQRGRAQTQQTECLREQIEAGKDVQKQLREDINKLKKHVQKIETQKAHVTNVCREEAAKNATLQKTINKQKKHAQKINGQNKAYEHVYVRPGFG